MELGEKIKAARQELGLSQRQLCGDTITRNMLSQIENGSARPSMQTLRYLAQGLGKSVSYFLEEQAVVSPNLAAMEAARQALARGDGAGVLSALEEYRTPDGVFDAEKGLLEHLGCVLLAGQALKDGRRPYAVTLLEKAGAVQSIYITAALERQRLLLLGRAGQKVAGLLTDEDDALLLRAGEALEAGDAPRCMALLEAVEHRDGSLCQLLLGEGAFALGQYEQAAFHFQNAEAVYPRQACERLEVCCRELGDFKRAYEYACRLRN
ncbi:MAG: helix-turn-helix transcriptional regulator [Oscillospiraceae bacterium]|nr:helix-turn-helix transcriptional regulator [Oscillospiraceae bacterium]